MIRGTVIEALKLALVFLVSFAILTVVQIGVYGVSYLFTEDYKDSIFALIYAGIPLSILFGLVNVIHQRIKNGRKRP